MKNAIILAAGKSDRFAPFTYEKPKCNFDSIDDLRMFDSEFLLNVDSEIITNICETLKCNPYSYRRIHVASSI